MTTSVVVLPPIYLALLRAGLSNDPALDTLLPISRWLSVDEAWMLETQCAMVNAISEERREAALLGGVNNVVFDAEQVLALQRLLPFFPYPAVASHVLDHSPQAAHPLRALEAVRAVAETSPAIAARYAAHVSAIGPIPVLRAVSLVARPPIETLTEAQRGQLGVLGSSWSLSAQQMLAYAQRAERELDLIAIEDATIETEGSRRVVLEAWLNEGNEGTIFRAGTTEEVAWMGQGGVPECSDRATLAALCEALGPKRIEALRDANGPSHGGPWAAYRDALGRSDTQEERTFRVTEVSGDGTLPPLIVPHEDDVPF